MQCFEIDEESLSIKSKFCPKNLVEILIIAKTFISLYSVYTNCFIIYKNCYKQIQSIKKSDLKKSCLLNFCTNKNFALLIFSFITGRCFSAVL